MLTFDADEMRWVAILMVGPQSAVLASAHAPLEDLSGLAVGERLIASIVPLSPRRRRFGLRR
ncbi:hypothetical protein [Actinotalea sp. C106]|uniref:hypothetical protein n=1 Tax=Actinotalea sp. C106 TaxID=2908644 RepID=UPI0020292D7A|nr:hypothetical protein [Actinotalea sp. C106]